MSLSSGSFWNTELFGGSFAPLVTRFWSWQRTEFLAFFPPETLVWLLDRGDRKFILRPGAAKELVLANAGPGEVLAPIPAEELQSGSLADALTRRGLRREATSIAIEIDKAAFFVRRFDIPLSARASLERLLAMEIERKTPFRPGQVVFGHLCRAHPASGEKLQVEQWILRRDIVSDALEGSGLSIADIDVIQASDRDEAGEAPTIRLGAGKPGASDWFRAAVVALCAAAGLLAATGVGLTLWRQAQAGAELESRVAQLSARAAVVRQLADRATGESRLLATLRQERRKYPLLADVWEEVSRLLPDGAYVTEMRLSESRGGERVLDLVGLADSAAGLPALFDKSPAFSDAALTSAITPDLQQKREGFSLQARVRHTEANAK